MHALLRSRAGHRLATAVLALAAAGLLAACGTASGSAGGYGSSAAAIGSSAIANPTISSDLNQGELLLQSNLQKHWDPAHPVNSVRAAIQETFPHGNVSQIEHFAVQHFTLAVMTTSGPGSARDLYLQEVYDDALAQGGATPSGSPSPAVTSSTA